MDLSSHLSWPWVPCWQRPWGFRHWPALSLQSRSPPPGSPRQTNTGLQCPLSCSLRRVCTLSAHPTHSVREENPGLHPTSYRKKAPSLWSYLFNWPANVPTWYVNLCPFISSFIISDGCLVFVLKPRVPVQKNAKMNKRPISHITHLWN